MSVDAALIQVLVLVGGVLLGMIVMIGLGRAARRAGGRRHQRHGVRAERQAERLLSRAGYTVVQRQPTETWILWVDGVEVEVRSRADLIVERDGRRLAAEIKSGRHGANPTRSHTRRQLLEYARAFDVDGVILVDMRRRRIHTVAFVAPV